MTRFSWQVNLPQLMQDQPAYRTRRVHPHPDEHGGGILLFDAIA
jgi:hypothetical protein